EGSGMLVNPESGDVIGRSGRKVGSDDGKGYLLVSWKSGGSTRTGRAHRLVWEAVNGPIPEGMEINHINGRKSDNRIENLEAVTRLQNMRHAYAAGLNRAIGAGNGRAKLAEAQVSEILRRHACGETARALAFDFGVNESAVGKIVRGERWINARAA